MDTLNTIWVWFYTLGGLGAVVLAIVAANKLKAKFEDVEANWRDAIMPSIAFLLIHLGIYWLWPVFWVNWFNSNGFILMQILIVAGLYTASLKTKPASFIGKWLTVLGSIGLAISVWSTGYNLYATAPKDGAKNAAVDAVKEYFAGPTKVAINVTAPVGARSEQINTVVHTSFKPQGPIWIYTDNGTVFESDKGEEYERIDIGRTQWVRFQSRTTTPITVIVIK